MVIDMGGEHIGVSYGKIKRTPGQLDCERAREIFEGVQPQAVRIGLTVAEDIDEISENLRVDDGVLDPDFAAALERIIPNVDYLLGSGPDEFAY